MGEKNRQFKREVRLRISIILDSWRETGMLTNEQKKELVYLRKLLETKPAITKDRKKSQKLPFTFDLTTFTMKEYTSLREAGYADVQIEKMCIGTSKLGFIEWKKRHGLLEK